MKRKPPETLQSAWLRASIMAAEKGADCVSVHDRYVVGYRLLRDIAKKNPKLDLMSDELRDAMLAILNLEFPQHPSWNEAVVRAFEKVRPDFRTHFQDPQPSKT